MLSKAARINDEVPIPTKPALAETFTEANCPPSSCTVAFPPCKNQVVYSMQEHTTISGIAYTKL